MLEFRIKTWRCPNCDYAQDFEPTKENFNIHFKNEMFQVGVRLEDDDCPACVLGKNPSKTKQKQSLQKESDPEKKILKRVLEEAEIETMTKEEPTGKTILVAGIETPEFKTKPLTKAEKDELKAQRLIDLAEIQGLLDE